MIKIREFKEKNYRGIFFNGKTIRIALDATKPILELNYPEFYDVDIFETNNGLCKANCPWCYLNGNENGKIVEDACKRIYNYFNSMSSNERPFQVAIPGSGELFEHPDWENILHTFHDLGIMPNYTTNGMFINLDSEITTEYEQSIINATKKYCGGVAISCHPHLEKYWTRASELYWTNGIKLNFHIIISDKKSIDYFKEIYELWKDKVDYFVLLPYGNQGRAKSKEIDWEYLIQNLPDNQSKLAFGANFYSYLQEGNHGIKVSLYEPEIMSGFLSLSDNKLYKSSFNLIEKTICT
jgi:hypothetical protein